MQQKQGRSAIIWACAEKKHNFILKKAFNLEVDQKKNQTARGRKRQWKTSKKLNLTY